MANKLRSLLGALLSAALLFSALSGCADNGGTPSSTAPSGSQTPAVSDDGGSAPAEAKVLRWNVGIEPTTLDPMLMGQEAMQVVNNTFEGLMRTYEGKQIPGMAETYEVSEDQLTYTFHLRDAKWSDGEPVTADDFVFAWFRMIDPVAKINYGKQFFCIKNAQEYYEGNAAKEDVGFKALDEKTLQVELVAPTPYFLSLTAFNIFYPVREDVADPEGAWSIVPETAVSNGPFKLSEFNLNENIVLVKNENYWNAENVKLDQIVVSFIVDPASAMTAYRSGDIDLFKSVPAQEIPQLAASDPEFHSLPMLGINYYVFNLEREPFNDVRVRQAFSLAIDRTALANNVTKGGEIPASGLVPHGIPASTGEDFRNLAVSYDNSLDPAQAQVEKAQALLAEAGYPNGEGFPAVTLIVNDSGTHPVVAQAVQQMWKENLNVDIELRVVDSQTISDTRSSGDFDIVRWGWSADYADPYNFLSIWISSSTSNYGKFYNDTYDQLLQNSQTATGTERDQMLLDAEEILINDECALLCLDETVDSCMIRSNVVGWDKTGFSGWYFGFTDITE